MKKIYSKNKVYEIVFFIIILLILIVIVLTNNKNNLKAHCVKAICNKDNTICYNYILDKKGKTIKTWEGNCSKIKENK